LSGRRRNRLTDFADQLRRALVEAEHRPLRIGSLGIEVETRAGGGNQQRFFLAGELASAAGPGFFARRQLEIAFHEAALGPIHRGEANTDVGGDGLIGFSGIGGEQDLRPPQPAGGMFAAA